MDRGKNWQGFLPKFLKEKGSEFSDMSDRNNNASYSDNDSNSSGHGGFQGPFSSKSNPAKSARRNRQQRERYRSRSPARSRSRSVRSFDSYNRSLSRSPVKHRSRSPSHSPLSQNYPQSPASFSRTPSPNYRRARSVSPAPRNRRISLSPASYISRSPSYRSALSQSPEPIRQRNYSAGSSQRSYENRRRSRSRTPEQRRKYRNRSPSMSDDGQNQKRKRKSRQRTRSPSFHGSSYTSSISDDDAANYQYSYENDDEEDGEIEMPVMGRLFVGNLNHKACKLDMKEVFEPFGNCEIYIGHNPGGYAFIQYDNDDDAIRCLKAVNNTEILGTQVRVKPCLPRIGGAVPRGKPGYVRGRTHSWIGLDGTKHNRRERLARGEWPYVHKEPPPGGVKLRGGTGRGAKFGARGRGFGTRGRGFGTRGRGFGIRGRGKGRGASRSRGRGRGRRSFIGRGRGADKFNETDTGYDEDVESDFKPPKRGHGFPNKDGFKSKEQRFRSRSPARKRKTLLETPTFKQPLLEASRPVLLPTPDEPPLPAEPASKSYKKGRPSSRKRYDSQQDDDGYSYQDEEYPKKRKSKSSIYKKYQKGNKYSDYRYDREHKDNYQRGPGLWGSPEDKRSDRAVASDVHYSNYAWPSTSQQHHQEYGQQGYRPATDQQQHGGYDYSSWASQQQQQAPAPPVPPSPIPPPAPAPVYSGYEQSSYQATSQWSHHQQPAAAAAGSEYQYQQQTGYHQSTYGEAAAGYQTWSTGEQTTQQHQGYAQPPAAQGAPGGPPYSTEQLIHLAKQFPELASSNILAQVTREQHSSKKSKQESSSRGKSKKKGEGYERLAAAYERLASVLEKAFKEDAPKPPMPPRAATPGHRSPERRSQSPRRFTASPRRPPTPTQDEMDHSRRTVLFPTREYKLF